jgi:hypothetical protein
MFVLDQIANQLDVVVIVLSARVAYPCAVDNRLLCVRGD